MQSTTNRSGIQCYEHPRQQITNYCVHYQCLRPLCPDCVEIHTKVHQRQQIQSWKHCINKAASSTKNTLDELRAIYEMLRQTKGVKSVEVVEAQNISKLMALRDRYHRLVDEVFNAHENNLRVYIRNQYKVDAPDTTKLKMAIEQMERVLMKLAHSNTVLASLKKCLLLDHKSVLQYFSHLKNNRPTNVSQVFFNENNSTFSQFRNILQKSIDFQKMNEPSLNDQIFSSPYRQPKSSRINAYQPLRIYNKQYFNADCKNKLLHFFIPTSNELKVERQNWVTIAFKSKGVLPCYFKSIITPKGQIYLTGGHDQGVRSKAIYRYNYQKNALQMVANMIRERSSHSICYLEGSIYIIGGFSEVQGEVTRQCELFNLSTMTCSKIASLNTPSANSCATPFRDQYIFKFGGIFNKMEGNSLIQMYSIKSNRWIVINIEATRTVPNLQLLSFSAAAQINESQILVFGGYENTEQEKPQRTCYALSINIESNSVFVKNYNTTPLPYAEGFWNNNPIIYKSCLYALQNVADQQDEQTALADERKVIIFSGDRWL